MREFIAHLKKNDIGDYVALAGTLFIFGLICKWHDIATMKIPV